MLDAAVVVLTPKDIIALGLLVLLSASFAFVYLAERYMNWREKRKRQRQ